MDSASRRSVLKSDNRRRIKWPKDNDFESIRREKAIARYPTLQYLNTIKSCHEWESMSERWRLRIEQRSRGQSESPFWYLYRRHLITASSSKKIYKYILANRLQEAGACIEKFGTGNLSKIPAVAYGLKTEPIA